MRHASLSPSLSGSNLRLSSDAGYSTFFAATPMTIWAEAIAEEMSQLCCQSCLIELRLKLLE